MLKARITVGASVIELEGEAEAISDAIIKINTGAAASAPRRRELKAGLRALFTEGFFLRPKALHEIRDALLGRQVAFGNSSLFPAIYKEYLRPGLLAKHGSRGNYRYYCRPAALRNLK